ncbi:TPA: restriction endonuclease subunit S [Enterobacter kobei]|uniref:restriction endonuclease subunit S n=1 Tax=Enterobacteriaceae TaxID=543 RepID=UPI000B9533F6|nr:MULTISPECIES: restriction endonuclease subunit S [Enterobacteriaceae]EAB9617010.1 restriction endonuclease subunit S [Salmonella enterica subsp. enterica serovar Mbandaka]EBS5851302.1 restriction endonuclease subunit S [Salmonella enterica subsp. enterica serovar Cerro]MBK4556135.1 restriction endonuclease subunit S [Enterobacter hormaechei]HBO0703321.1 restriction endonuclease subunit S [Enterobacter kobei]HCI8640611.1 restriction endonuclease subunit S [Enterobacter hormaechei subsp. xian
MSQYRAYPAYKDSGIEWIGQVPEHWKVARVKRLASLRNERRNDVSTDTIYIGLEDVEAGSGQYKPTNGSSRQSEDSTVGIFYEGDVLYGKLRPYLRKAIISEMAGCCSTEFLVLRAEKTEPRWLQEWLLTPDVTHQIESGCEGAKMPRADWGHIGSIEVVYPDQPEQAQILTTLDRETARIDALVEKKTRFIELLKEKRQALITHAVTKGLDPNVKMKDSGVEWIGQVPEHWEVKPFKYILSAPMSYGANESAESDDPNHPRYIRITDLTENGTLREDTFKTLPWDKAYSYLLSDGDILLARSGATVGKSFLYRETNGAACFAGYLIKASCNEEKALPKYIYAYLQSHSYWEYISGSNIQSTIQNVSAEKYSSMVLPVPQREEQATIAATLDRETARIDALIGKAEQSISLLKERRSAFITAAVTGQIDLRGKQ